MSAFTIVHQDRVVGKLVCFDRLIFKGHLGGFNIPGRSRHSCTARGCCSSISTGT